jgi:hypothetical protein
MSVATTNESQLLHFDALGEQPLGRHLLLLLTKLCFMPNFTTAPVSSSSDEHRNVLWYGDSPCGDCIALHRLVG